MRKTPSNVIPGFHGIREILVQGRVRVKEVCIAEEKRSQRAREILDLAQSCGVPVRFVKIFELERRFPGLIHQGMIAVTEPFSYSSLEETARAAVERARGRALLLVADHITDEGNLGALIRTGAFFGADGLILPKDRSALVSPSVVKRSSGAFGMIPVCKVVNLARELGHLSRMGFWIIGASGDSSKSVYQFDWKRDAVLILGNEERGLTDMVRKRCHSVVGIPRVGPVDSLNVSVAAGVILGEIRRQQGN